MGALSFIEKGLKKAGTDVGHLGGDAMEFLGKSETSGTRDATSRQEQFLEIDEEGIQRMIQDILGGTEGLASIFSGEQATGLYSSSAAAGEAGNLLAQLGGELAKITGKQIATGEEHVETTGEQIASPMDIIGQLASAGEKASGI